jgi:hypothetical protein
MVSKIFSTVCMMLVGVVFCFVVGTFIWAGYLHPDVVLQLVIAFAWAIGFMCLLMMFVYGCAEIEIRWKKYKKID